MQTSVSRDGIVANKGEMLGKVRFANNTRRKTRVELLQFSRKLTLRVGGRESSFSLYLRRVFCTHDL
jgi:hypothetical protein